MDRQHQTCREEEFIGNYMAADIPESEIVNRKMRQAYEEIRRTQRAKAPTSVPLSQSFKKPAAKRPQARRTAAKCTAAAAVFFAVLIFFVRNPALAAQLPFIGHIFKDLEQQVSYPGNYSENSVTLPPLPEETNEHKEAVSQESASPSRQVKSGSMTITLSEATYDSNAVYLALLAENSDGFAENAQADNFLYFTCQTDMYRPDGSKKTFSEENGNSLAYIAEGEFTDSNTFKGIVQLTSSGFHLSDYTGADITFLEFKQDLTTGPTVTATLPGESETISYTEYDQKIYSGSWSFHLDFSDLQNAEQEILLNQTNDLGFGVEKVVKTRYEIYAVPIIPAGKESYDYVVTIWDANGQPLESHGSQLEVRSLYGRDVSKVTIYILTWDDFMECKGNNSYLQPQKAVFSTTVDLEE